MKTIKRHIALFLTVSLLLTGCKKDPVNDPNTGTGTVDYGDQVEMTFTSSVLGAGVQPNATASARAAGASASVFTRSLVDPNDHKIGTLDVLVFNVNGTAETFSYKTHATNITNDATADKQFKIMLKKTGTSQRLVFIANARDEVEDALSTFTSSTTKADAMEVIMFAATTEWNTGTDARLLPMWAEGSGVSPVAVTVAGSAFGDIKFLRSVARIDVGVNFNSADPNTVDGLGTLFTFDEVWVYNTLDEGHVVPDPLKLGPTEVTGITLPPSANINGVHKYTSATPATGMLGDIFVPECENAGKQTDKVCFLLVGGYYTATGDPLNTSIKTWYRLDFKDNNGAAVDLLRNYRYLVNITAVTGPGANDPDEAKTAPSNLSAHVVPWNQVSGDFELTSNYTLEIDKTHFKFGADGRGLRLFDLAVMDLQGIIHLHGDHEDMFLKIHTDHEDGWQVNRIVDTETNTELLGNDQWVTIKTDDIYALNPVTGQFEIDKTQQNYLHMMPNIGTSVRHARIDVGAGDLEYSVYVTQDHLGRCGRDDDAETESLVINGNSYPTHIYADFNSFLTVRCWMVKKNLAEIEAQYDNSDYVLKRYTNDEVTYAEGERGYYYSSRKINAEGFDPCPEGWHVPNYMEEVVFMPILLAGKVQGQLPFTSFDAKQRTHTGWWVDDPENNLMYAGYATRQGAPLYNDIFSYWGNAVYNHLSMGVRFDDTEMKGTAAHFALTFISENYGDPVLAGNIISMTQPEPGPDQDYFTPVRCIKDMDNKGL